MEINATSSLSSPITASIPPVGDIAAGRTIDLSSSIKPTGTLARESFASSASNHVIDSFNFAGTILSSPAESISISESTLTGDSETLTRFTDNSVYSSLSRVDIGNSLLSSSADGALYTPLHSDNLFSNTLLSPTDASYNSFSQITSDTLTSLADNTLSYTQTSTSNSLLEDISKSVTFELSPSEPVFIPTINASHPVVTVVESFSSIEPSLTVFDSTLTPSGDFATSTVSFSDTTSVYNEDWSLDGVFFNSNTTLHLDNTSLFTTYEEYSDDITIVIGIFVPLVVVALLVAAFVCYAKYWKKRGFKKKNGGRAKVSFSDNPVVSGSVLAPRYSDAEGCKTNVFAELPDKKDGFVTIDLSEDGKATNGGLNITRNNSGQKNDASTQNLESICEKEELSMSEEEHNEETEVKFPRNTSTDDGNVNLENENKSTDDAQYNSDAMKSQANDDTPPDVDENVHYDNNINLISGKNSDMVTENPESVNGYEFFNESNDSEEITKL